jgi:hypothetical protein
MCVSRFAIGANNIFSNGAIVTDIIPAKVNSNDPYINIFHQHNFWWFENALFNEYLPYSFLLANNTTNNSIGNSINIAKRKNNKRDGIVFCNK